MDPLSLLGGFGGLLGNIFGGGNDEAQKELARNQQLYGDLGKFQLNNPEQYSPEDAQYQTVSEDPRIREQQMNYLMKLSGLADSGLSDEDRAIFEEANINSGAQARQNREAGMAAAQRRGVGGSGLEFVNREMGNQDAISRSHMAGLEQAAAAAKQRALYNTAYGSALTSQRGQDYTVNKGNTDIINKFNAANTDARNQAQQYNIQNRKDTDAKNIDYRFKQAAGLSGANKDKATANAADSAANNALWGGIGTAAGTGLGYAAGLKPKEEKQPTYNIYTNAPKQDDANWWG